VVGADRRAASVIDLQLDRPIEAEELARVEEIANRVLLQNEPVVTKLMAVDDGSSPRRCRRCAQHESRRRARPRTSWPGRRRRRRDFDISHPKPIEAEELARVEEIANRVLLQNEPVVTLVQQVGGRVVGADRRAASVIDLQLDRLVEGE
jgi:alanyl-tRNA synthetase